MPHLLFVCTGNTCRSPMAEYILKKLIKEEGKYTNWKIKSAGLAAVPGLNASADVIQILDLDEINQHTSQSLTEDIIESSDLILTMTENHKKMILNYRPQVEGKVYTLKEFVGNKDELDISDPYGQGKEIYRKTKEEIEEALYKLLGKMNQFDDEAGKFKKTENIKNRGELEVKIAIGSDHAGYELKQEILKYLQEEKIDFKDMGTDSSESVDYPDYGYKVAKAVASGEFDKGILVCGTGIGMSITANKVKNIRAALCHDVFSAKATRNHNNSNVLTLGSRVVGIGLAVEIVKTWLGTDFDGGRHERRVNKMHQIERGEYKEDE
ncbi:MAG: ribose 5-phosphate isomerase B [Halothermotrichaceae bacterium]